MRNLGLLIFVSLSVAACAEDTVAGPSSGGGGGGGGGGGTADTGFQDTGATDTGSQAQPENCADGVDNDFDGRTDCSDTECSSSGPCLATQRELCSNRVDENGNGLIDCADPDCRGVDPCNGENCSDSRDNDLDGASDCDDSQCAGNSACNNNCVDVYGSCDGQNICVGSNCVGVYSRSWTIDVDSILLSTSVNWDAFGNQPDPYIIITIGSRTVLNSNFCPDSYECGGFSVTTTINSGESMGVSVKDDDAAADDPVLDCSPWSLTADRLNNGVYSCSSESASVEMRFTVR